MDIINTLIIVSLVVVFAGLIYISNLFNKSTKNTEEIYKIYENMLKISEDGRKTISDNYMAYLKSNRHNKENYKLIYINYQLLKELSKYTDEVHQFDYEDFENWFNQLGGDDNND